MSFGAGISGHGKLRYAISIIGLVRGLMNVPDTTAKRFSGPRSAKRCCIPSRMELLQKLSTTSRNVMLRIGAERECHANSSCAQSEPDVAWKADSGDAMCIAISFMTILGGKLLKMTKA